MNTKIYDEIYEYVIKLEIIDTHEHLPPYESKRQKDTDILKEYLSHYFSCDLVSAGLKQADLQKVVNNKLPLMERWNLVEPYWEIARNTGYGRSLDITVKGIYGIEKICRTIIEELNNLFLESLKQSGQFKKVLKDKSKIKISLLDCSSDSDKMFFKSVYRIDPYIFPLTFEELKQREQESGIKINSFDNWLEMTEIMLNKFVSQGTDVLKTALAYHRILRYEHVTKNEAEDGFNEIFRLKNTNTLATHFNINKKFQDYMMHFILSFANKRNLTIQFHTGLQEGIGNIISNSDPSLLTNLFLEYPDIKFDLFHIGYPYQHLLSAISKNFQNVFIDMCWANIISPVACVNALVEYLDSVPINKISAFGGDYLFIDGVYGHQYLARENISKALTKKVEDGAFNIDRAKEIAKMIFYENPLKIFGIKS